MKRKKRESGFTNSRGRGKVSHRTPRTAEVTLKLDRIGQLIREARLNQGMTQEELAELVDVTPAYIGHIERSQRSFSLQTLVKLVTELDMDMNDLFSDTISSEEEKVVSEFRQLMKEKPIPTQEAVLDIVRTALRYL